MLRSFVAEFIVTFSTHGNIVGTSDEFLFGFIRDPETEDSTRSIATTAAK